MKRSAFVVAAVVTAIAYAAPAVAAACGDGTSFPDKVYILKPPFRPDIYGVGYKRPEDNGQLDKQSQIAQDLQAGSSGAPVFSRPVVRADQGLHQSDRLRQWRSLSLQSARPAGARQFLGLSGTPGSSESSQEGRPIKNISLHRRDCRRRGTAPSFSSVRDRVASDPAGGRHREL